MGRGIYRTSYNFHKADYFDIKRSKILNTSFIFSFFYSDKEFAENKPSMREQIHGCTSTEKPINASFISQSSLSSLLHLPCPIETRHYPYIINSSFRLILCSRKVYGIGSDR